MIGDVPIAWLMQINPSYSMSREVNIENSVRGRRPQSYSITAKSFADPKITPSERDPTTLSYFTYLVYRAVLDRRQMLGKRSLTRFISAGRDLHLQSFMRPHVIVAMAPFVKSRLYALEVGKQSIGQHFDFQGAMKAFFLTLRLRMIRTAVRNGNAKLQQPNRQWREPMQDVIAPGRTIVHQHPLGQAIAPKSCRQLLLNGRCLFIAAGLQAKRITRMVIEHSERVTAFMIAQTKVSLEIHLPELVRSLVFESLRSTPCLLRHICHALITQKDRVHSALSQGAVAVTLETRLDLACSPAVSIANRQHLFFDPRLAVSRRMQRSTRTIGQASDALISIPSPPFVTGLSADAEPVAQLTKIGSHLLSHRQKLLSQIHGRTLLPRHVSLLKKVFMPLSNVLPMSSDTCYPCVRYVQLRRGGRGFARPGWFFCDANLRSQRTRGNGPVAGVVLFRYKFVITALTQRMARW